MYDLRSGQAPVVVSREERSQVRDFWHVIRRNRVTVLAVLVVVVALSAVYTWLQDPVYESTATMQIDAPSMGPTLLQDLSPLGGGGGAGQIETDVLVLRSRQIAAAVVDSLGLQVVVTEPASRRDRVLTVLASSSTATPATVVLTHQSGGRYSVTVEPLTQPSPPIVAPATVDAGAVFRIDGVSMQLDPGLREAPPEQIRFTIRSYWRAVGDLRQGLAISRVDPYAKMVSIGYRSSDPLLASAVPNVAAESFIRFKARSSRTESRSTVEFLRGQVDSYDTQLTDAERELREYREREQVVNIGEQASEQVRRLAEITARRDELRAEQAALSLLLRTASRTEASSSTTSPYRQLASFPVFLGNRAVQDILQAITELENQRSELLVLRTPESPDVRGLNSRIQELELQLYEIARSYLASLETQIASSDAMLAQFDTQMATIPAREIELARLMRQQTLLAELSTLLQTRLKEAEIGEAVEPGDVRVIDHALVPDRPVAPRPLMNLFLGTVLGAILGFSLVFAREMLDTKVRTREDIDAATSGMPIIGTIPRIQAAPDRAVAAGGNGRNGSRRVVRLDPKAMIASHLVTSMDRRSPASEAYRALRTNLTFSRAGSGPRVIVVTSAMPGDGKSTSSSNLAITLCQQGTRTVLIDADLRKGILNRVFGLEQSPGLTHLLLGHETLENVVREVPIDDRGGVLHVIPSGIFPPDPSELLGSEAMRELLERLRSEYGMVLLDAPPLSLVTDAAILGTMADASVLVTRAGVTDKRALHHAANQLHQVRAAVGGVVLNDIDEDTDGGYYGAVYGSEYSGGDAGGNGKH
jgi:capsular exopolysaccharide synthesis family protein